MLWTANTERYCDVEVGLNDTAEHLLESIRSNKHEVSPSTIFAVASVREGVRICTHDVLTWSADLVLVCSLWLPNHHNITHSNTTRDFYPYFQAHLISFSSACIDTSQ